MDKSNTNSDSSKIPKPACPNLDNALLEKDHDILKKLGQGTYGITFRGCYDTACSLKQGIKLSSIKITRYPDNNKHPTNLEVNVGKEISQYVDNNETPHINRILESFRCSISDLKHLKSFKDTEWMKETREMLKKNEVLPYVNIYFMDLGTIDLHKFIKYRCKKKNIQFNEILEILFQVMHTLTVIQSHLKHYRHNDLKPNNLLVQVSRNDLDRDFNSFTLCDQYTNAGKNFFLPYRGYTVKIIDFDFTYSHKYQNAKITTFKDTNFKTIGYGPFINPVFDTHFLLNSFYESNTIMKCIPKFKKFIELLLPSNCLGEQNEYVERSKLTSYYVNGKTNYIPSKMLTPIEMIHFTKYFNDYKDQQSLKVRKHFSTKFKAITSELRQRTDMFNVFLRKH